MALHDSQIGGQRPPVLLTRGHGHSGFWTWGLSMRERAELYDEKVQDKM